jgi:hypothetical protein
LKKFIAILLLPFYLLSSGGVNIVKHFCEGELCKIAVTTSTSTDCCCEKQSTDKGCCQNETSYYKLNQDQSKHESVSINTITFQEVAVLNNTFNFNVESNYNYYSKPLFNNNFANNFTGPPKYILINQQILGYNQLKHKQ